MSKAIYDCVNKYKVTAVCEGPLHIGNSSGDGSEVLIHPVDGNPFIQATGICGALRDYCKQIAPQEIVNGLFGGIKNNQENILEESGTEEKESDDVNNDEILRNENEQDKGNLDVESKIRVMDGKFTHEENVKIELRPRVKIDPATGTVFSQDVKSGDIDKSGQKFDMQYISAGSEFSFVVYLYGGNDQEEELLKKAFAAMNAGEIQFGGQKSNGCGYLKDVKVKYKHYDMKNKDDLRGWILKSDDDLEEMDLPELKPEEYVNAFEIKINASTEGELLVKAIAPEGSFGEDASNIRNVNGEYIVPGSSFKGAIRNRMEMIAKYIIGESKCKELIIDGFGSASESGDGSENGKIGNLRFADIIVGDENGENSKLRTRIHIDKFTGGVINQMLFKELNVYGDMEIRIYVSNHSNPDAVTALLLLAIRDLHYKLFSVGGGQSVGKGYLDINEVKIVDRRSGDTCCFNNDFKLTGEEKVLKECMENLIELKEQISA